MKPRLLLLSCSALPLLLGPTCPAGLQLVSSQTVGGCCVFCVVVPTCKAPRPPTPPPRWPCPSSGEEMPSPEEAHLKDFPAPFVLPVLSSLDGMVSQAALVPPPLSCQAF